MTSGGFLRQRKVPCATALVTKSIGDVVEGSHDDHGHGEDVVWGQTPGGEGIYFFLLISFLHLSSRYSLPRTDDT